MLRNAPRTEDLPPQRILSVYLNNQDTFLVKDTTSHECLASPRHETFNSPFVCQLEMLLSLDAFLQYPFSILDLAKTIRFVSVLDNE